MDLRDDRPHHINILLTGGDSLGQNGQHAAGFLKPALVVCAQTPETQHMAESDVIANQKLILENQREIKANQQAIKDNQAAILKNQATLNTIVANQEKILGLLKK